MAQIGAIPDRIELRVESNCVSYRTLRLRELRPFWPCFVGILRRLLLASLIEGRRKLRALKSLCLRCSVFRRRPIVSKNAGDISGGGADLAPAFGEAIPLGRSKGLRVTAAPIVKTCHSRPYRPAFAGSSWSAANGRSYTSAISARPRRSARRVSNHSSLTG